MAGAAVMLLLLLLPGHVWSLGPQHRPPFPVNYAPRRVPASHPQLNILGRHLYLESAVEGRWAAAWRGRCGKLWMVLLHAGVPCGPLRLLSACMFDPYFCSPPPPHSLSRSGMRKPAGLPKLSAPSQERFLSYSEFLAQQGAARLLGLLRGACEGALASVQLQEALTPHQLAALMQRIADAMVAAVQQAAGSRSWAAFLLPGPEELREGLAPRAPDNRAFMLGGEALVVDAEVVTALADEAEAVAAGDEFAAALQVWSGLAG